MSRKVVLQSAGALCVVGALMVSGLWARALNAWMDELLVCLLTGLVLAGGLWLLGAVDQEALGSFGEALAGAVLGVLLLLFGRVMQGGNLAAPPWHDAEWTPAVPPATTLAAALIALLLARCAERAAHGKMGGFSARRFAVIALAVLVVCFHLKIDDWLREIPRDLVWRMENMRGEAGFWNAVRLGVLLLFGLALLPFARRGKPHGAYLTAVGGAYLALFAIGYFATPAALPALRWLGVTYGDAPLYAGLLFMGLFALCGGKRAAPAERT